MTCGPRKILQFIIERGQAVEDVKQILPMPEYKIKCLVYFEMPLKFLGTYSYNL